ncbi:MAG: restriction endonuclease subunit S, partial [Spirochaetota bacterium]
MREEKIGHRTKSSAALGTEAQRGEGEMPEGWAQAKIGEVGFVQLGRQRAPKFHSGATMRPYLRVQNVFDDRIDLDDVMEMDFPGDDVERYELKVGDILLNEGQSPELLGRPAMYMGELPGACFTNTIIRFQAGPTVNSRFCLQFFRHYMKNGTFRGEGTITTNIAHLGAGRFAALGIPLPPLHEQERIAARLDLLLGKLKAARKRLDAVPELVKRFRKSVLAEAVSGRLTEEWREEHAAKLPSAEELLATVWKERRAAWEKAELEKMRAKGKVSRDEAWKAKYIEPEPVEADVPFPLPDNWLWVKFGETVHIASDLVDPRSDPDQIHVAPNHI